MEKKYMDILEEFYWLKWKYKFEHVKKYAKLVRKWRYKNGKKNRLFYVDDLMGADSIAQIKDKGRYRMSDNNFRGFY